MVSTVWMSHKACWKITYSMEALPIGRGTDDTCYSLCGFWLLLRQYFFSGNLNHTCGKHLYDTIGQVFKDLLFFF